MTRRTGARRALLAMLAMGLAVTAGCGGGEARKARHVEDGRELMAERNYTKARIEFRNALQIDPKDAAVRELVGVTSEKLGEYDDAVKAYRIALAADDSLVTSRARLARLMALAGLSDEAMELLAPGLERVPNSGELLSVRAVVRGQKGESAEARKDAEQAFALEPTNPDVVATLAAARWQAGEREETVALLGDAIARSPDSLELRLLQARLLLVLDRPADAERQLVEVVRLDPSRLEYHYTLAQAQLMQGKADRAIEVLTRAVADNPHSVEAKIALAELLASHRSRAAADQQLQKFRDEAPKDFDLQLAVGRFYEAGGRDEEAAAIYGGVVEAADERPQAMTARGRLAALKFRNGRTDEASALVAEVLRENPADADALVIRSEIALRRGDASAAVVDLRAAYANQPDSVPLASALARAHVQAGDDALAEQILRSLVQANPRDVPARFALAQFLINSGRVKEARPVLDQLVAEQPGNVQALEGLARLQVATRDIDGALRTAAMIQSLQPESPTGFLLEGQVRQGAGGLEQAREAYERAAAADPAAVDPVAALVRLDVAENKADRALARLDERLASEPGNVMLQALRGDVLMSMKRPGDALASYAAALKLMPGSAQLYRAQSGAYMAMSQPDKAIETLQAGLAVTRQSPAITTDLAGIYAITGRIDDAIRTYESLLDRNPSDLAAANNLAMLLVTHRSDERSLERAVGLTEKLADSQVPAFLDTRGWVLYKRGRYVEAAAELQKAVSKAPGARELHYHLGMAQLKLGQAEQARKNLEAAAGPGPDYEGLTEARATLAGM